MSSDPSYGSWPPPVMEPPGEPPAPADGGASRWAPWSAPLALLTAFSFALMGGLVANIVGAAFGAEFEDPPPAVNIVATALLAGAFIGAALLFAARAGRVLPAQFGLVPARIRPAIGWMIVAYVVYIGLGALWGAIVDTDAQSLPDSLGVEESTAALVAVCVVVTVIAPIAEEVFFRGYFYGALRNWRGPWPAALVTGAVFGAIHLLGGTEPVFLVPLAILGVMLCVVRERTGSLLPCIALHAVNNALAFGITQDWPGGAVLLLAVGAVATTLLACEAVMRPAAGAAGARPLG